MAIRGSLTGRISQAWAAAQAGWSGPAADAYYRDFILPMQESAGQLEAACVTLEDSTRQLDSVLARIERDLDD